MSKDLEKEKLLDDTCRKIMLLTQQLAVYGFTQEDIAAKFKEIEEELRKKFTNVQDS